MKFFPVAGNEGLSLTSSRSIVNAGSSETSRSSTPTSNQPPTPEVTLRGVDFHAIREKQAVEHILERSRRGVGGRVVTPNLHILRNCSMNPEILALVQRAHLRLADGMPIVWVSHLQGTPLPQRVTGSNLIYSLSEAAAEAGMSVFMLGGNPNMAEVAAKILTEQYPGLNIVGTSCPPFGFEKDPKTYNRVIEEVVEAQPDIVFVGLGCPKQERLMERISERLPNAWLLGIGYSFSFVAGEVPRAPLWVQKIGMEWLHRLSKEPRRLARRYLLEGIPFFARLLVSTAASRFTGHLKRTASPE
jgi:N-acetylglucosaminyldiphosphoundecaprenol N-acetyl-beta-D-mannosaminyltransferase